MEDHPENPNSQPQSKRSSTAQFGAKYGWSWVLPGSMRALADTWHTQHFSQSGNYIWNLIPAAIVHTIWKERNCRRFEPTHLFKTDNDLILEVKTLVLIWAEAAGGGEGGGGGGDGGGGEGGGGGGDGGGGGGDGGGGGWDGGGGGGGMEVEVEVEEIYSNTDHTIYTKV
ncbi:cold and drought-regulated protein CORA-like [Papaver somniferum]|uniref:cold and drought-regulated protein CORA-like n=1 Tax=Papaver somniferum TaxID=3469 RepID=UPI000E6FD2CE|nr:cold and drought-regulated protein CORA-like [Papaver somniferum]